VILTGEKRIASLIVPHDKISFMSRAIGSVPSGVTVGRRLVPVVIGSALVLLGLVGFFSMEPSAIAGTLSDGAAMGSVLGIQFFVGLLLIVYGAVIAGRAE
jgi:hypothetical protein